MDIILSTVGIISLGNLFIMVNIIIVIDFREGILVVIKIYFFIIIIIVIFIIVIIIIVIVIFIFIFIVIVSIIIIRIVFVVNYRNLQFLNLDYSNIGVWMRMGEYFKNSILLGNLPSIFIVCAFYILFL